MSSISFIYEIVERGKVIVGRTWETECLDDMTFAQLYENITPDNVKHRAIAVDIGYKLPHKEPSQFVNARINQKLSLLNLQGANFVRFSVSPAEINSAAGRTENAFQKLMSSVREKVLPASRVINTNKDVLFNNILSTFQDRQLGFLKGTEDSHGKDFINYLCNFIWFLDPHWRTLKDAVGMKMPDFAIDIYKKNSEGGDSAKIVNYNDYQTKKVAKPRCTQDDLSKFVFTGSEYLQTVWFSKPEWCFLRESISQMVTDTNNYVTYLKQKANTMKELYSSHTPARTPLQDGECFTLEGTDKVLPSLSTIDEQLLKAETYEPIFLNDMPDISTMNKYQKYVHFKKLREHGISVPVTYFKYSPHAGICTYHFLWKLPDKASRDDSMYIRLSSKISAEIPVFHTRAMKAEFKEHFASIAKLKPSVVRAMYQFLTDDASASTNESTKLVDDRVEFALSSDDPDVVFDLREHGTGKAGKYDAFWEALSKVIERDFPPASDERRHGEQVYLPVAISVRDLIEKVKEVNPDALVPSESWILLQFTPKDNRRHAALNYTSRFNIVYKIQSRSHHTNHADTYYCMSLFKILRSFAVRYRNETNFFCEDDKHGINIGEPGDPLSSLLRGRKVMVVKDQEPECSDHDWHRFKATPSVGLHCDIPESIEESFYSGQIYVTVKDAIFEKSTALRHTAERNSIHETFGGCWQPIECMFTDGGPDHNPNHYSVRIAHIAHFLKNDLDMLAAACTYPGGSYVDPAERCMPLLNLALNGVSLSRTEMKAENEKSIKNCNSMDEIRKACQDDEELQHLVQQSVKPCIDLIKNRFCRVTLKDKPIVIGETASDDDIENVFKHLSLIDSDLGISETTKEAVQKHQTFMKWFTSHTRCRRYIFQIRKCNRSPINEILKQECRQYVENSNHDAEIKTELLSLVETCQTCADLAKIIKQTDTNSNTSTIQDLTSLLQSSDDVCIDCKPPRLPLQTFINLFWVPDPTPCETNPEKFQHFEELYGQDTKEVFRPTFIENLDEDNKKLLVKEKVLQKTDCTNCRKPRIVYGAKKAFKEHCRTLCLQLEAIYYVCGMSIFPDGHSLEKILVTRKMINCDSPVEIQYYSSGKYPRVCYWCGLDRQFVLAPENLKARFREIYPLCQDCDTHKKKFFTKLPIKRKGVPGNASGNPKKKK